MEQTYKNKDQSYESLDVYLGAKLCKGNEVSLFLLMYLIFWYVSQKLKHLFDCLYKNIGNTKLFQKYPQRLEIQIAPLDKVFIY